MHWKKVLKRARGFYGRANRAIKIARMRVEKGLLHARRNRFFRRRVYHTINLQRINAGTRAYNVPYASFWQGLKKTNIDLNRKILAELAVNEPYSFKAVVDCVRTHHMMRPHAFPQKGLLVSSIVETGRTPRLVPPRPINFLP